MTLLSKLVNRDLSTILNHHRPLKHLSMQASRHLPFTPTMNSSNLFGRPSPSSSLEIGIPGTHKAANKAPSLKLTDKGKRLLTQGATHTNINLFNSGTDLNA